MALRNILLLYNKIDSMCYVIDEMRSIVTAFWLLVQCLGSLRHKGKILKENDLVQKSNAHIFLMWHITSSLQDWKKFF